MGGGKRISHAEEINLNVVKPIEVLVEPVETSNAIEAIKVNLKRKSTRKIINKVIKKSLKAATKRSK